MMEYILSHFLEESTVAKNNLLKYEQSSSQHDICKNIYWKDIGNFKGKKLKELRKKYFQSSIIWLTRYWNIRAIWYKTFFLTT